MARRSLLLALIAACEAPAPAVEAPPPQWVYAPAPSGWPVGAVQGRFGRAQAPQPIASLGIAGTQRVPLRLATLWDVPDAKKPARAVAYGYEGVQSAVELIDIDAGRVVWREVGLCNGPVVGVTDAVIVCSDGVGVRGVALDGTSAWQVELPFVAMTEDRIVVATEGHAVLVDATTGDEMSRVKLPAGLVAETVVASCGDAGRELFIVTADRMLARIADVKGKPVETWRIPLAAFEAIDACESDHVLVLSSGSLLSFTRATGAAAGQVAEVRGFWPARDGTERLDVATIAGVASWSRDLVDSHIVLAAPLRELVSTRGDRRLVRATSSTMVVLDRDGVAAYLPLAHQSAVLGDTAIAAASYAGSRANAITRVALPPRYARSLRVSPPSKGMAVPTELRDFEGLSTILFDDAIAKADTGKASVGPVAIDPAASNILYVAAAEQPIDDDTPQAIAAIDLATKEWLWQRADACGPGTVKAIVVTADIVACGTQGTRPGTALVRATSRSGEPRWEWEGDGVDNVTASRSLVLASSGDRAFVLDAATGRTRLTLVTHDGAMPAAIVDTREWGALVIAAQHGRLVARAANFDMRPVWALAIDGVATAVQAAGDGALVQLEDGDAYRIAADGTAIAMPGIGLEWHAHGDLLAGLTLGGPLYGEPLPRTPRIAPAVHGVGRKLLAPPDPELPRLWTPMPLPPVTGAGQQVTIYEPTGGLRVRAELDLGDATWGPRGPAGSPILLVAKTPQHQVVVIDPRTGSPLQRHMLAPGMYVFSTIVNGSPVAGVVASDPLRVVLF